MPLFRIAPRFSAFSPVFRTVCVGASTLLICAGVSWLRNENSAVAQPVLGGPVQPIPAPNSAKTAPQNAPKPTPKWVLQPVATARPTVAPIAPLPRHLIRVGLSTAGKTPEIYAPHGLVLRDKFQGRALRVGAGERVQFISGPLFEAKVGAQTFRGPIFLQIGEKTSQGWQHLQIEVNRGSEWPRVTTDGKSARWGRPYRGDFEVFPQQDAEKWKRKGALAIVNVVPLEEYLKGVVPWEMSPSAPLEALKAQAICARTKTLQFAATKKFRGFDVCDYDACQGYPGTENEKPSTTRAVEETRGLAIFHRGQVIDAVFSTNSGGISAAATDVWNSSSATPYLPSVRAFAPDSPLAQIVKPQMSEADWSQYFSQAWPSHSRPDEEMREKLAQRRAKSAATAALYGPDDWPEFYRWKRELGAQNVDAAFARHGFARISSFEIVERAPSGRIRQLKISGYSPQALQNAQNSDSPNWTPDKTLLLVGDSKIRSMFSGQMGSTTALPSSSFTISPVVASDGRIEAWVLRGAGWGHGVGMCQRAAQNLAKNGWDARRILNYFYREIELRNVGS